jgi:hypothetical protein
VTRKRTKLTRKPGANGKGKLGRPEPDAPGPAIPTSDEPVPGWWPAFLLDYTITNCVTLSAGNCGVTYQAVYALCERRPELKAQFDAAADVRAGMLRQFAWQAATEGVKLPIKALDGTVIGHTHKWDARVLLAMMQAELPEFRGRAEGGPTVNVTIATPGVPEGFRAFADAAREYLAGQARRPGPPGRRDVPPAVVDRPDVSHSGGGRPVGAR